MIFTQLDRNGSKFWHRYVVEICQDSGRTFDGIFAYFDFNCLSTVPIEGTNNKIKTIQRKAYGYRDMEFFKLKIMTLHKTKYALVG